MFESEYGVGPNGPGHCFHQHLTFYLRVASKGIPPVGAYPNYVLGWDDVWPGIMGRRQIFNVAAEHFAEYTKRVRCFERFGLQIERVPFRAASLAYDVDAAAETDDLLLSAVDTYYLPSFVEHQKVHGLTICALLSSEKKDCAIRCWHWENSALVPNDVIACAIHEQGSKLWRLHLNHEHRFDARGAYKAAHTAHAVLAEGATQSAELYNERIKGMLAEDPPLPEAESERKILFHVPYRRLDDGSFLTVWLVRSGANRLMHARGVLEEFLFWAGESLSSPEARELAELAHTSFIKWKALNVVCARYELGYPNTASAPIFQQLSAALEADRQLGTACERLERVSLWS